jgi:hypothetical protein
MPFTSTHTVAHRTLSKIESLGVRNDEPFHSEGVLDERRRAAVFGYFGAPPFGQAAAQSTQSSQTSAPSPPTISIPFSFPAGGMAGIPIQAQWFPPTPTVG